MRKELNKLIGPLKRNTSNAWFDGLVGTTHLLTVLIHYSASKRERGTLDGYNFLGLGAQIAHMRQQAVDLPRKLHYHLRGIRDPHLRDNEGAER